MIGTESLASLRATSYEWKVINTYKKNSETSVQVEISQYFYDPLSLWKAGIPQQLAVSNECPAFRVSSLGMRLRSSCCLCFGYVGLG